MKYKYMCKITEFFLLSHLDEQEDESMETVGKV